MGDLDAIYARYEAALAKVDSDATLTEDEKWDRELALDEQLERDEERGQGLYDEYEALLVSWGLREADTGPQYDPDTGEDVFPEPVKPHDTERLRKFLARIPTVLALRDRITERQGYRRMGADWSVWEKAMLPDLNTVNRLSKMTLLEVRFRWHEGDRGAAYEGLEKNLLMARHLDHEPTTIGVLVSESIRDAVCGELSEMISEQPPKSEQIERLSILLTVDPVSVVRSALVSECVGFNGLWERCIAGQLGSASARRPLFMPLSLKASLVSAQARFLQFHDGVIRAASGPPAQAIAQLNRAYAKIDDVVTGEPGVDNSLLGLTVSDLTTFVHKVFSDAARNQMAIVALHLASFRHNSGAYPEALADLPDADRLPGDLFSEKPLKYRRDGDGFVLWSVGPDGDDDGGKTHDELTAADPATSRDDGDIAFRVPPVDGVSGESSSE